MGHVMGGVMCVKGHHMGGVMCVKGDHMGGVMCSWVITWVGHVWGHPSDDGATQGSTRSFFSE